MWVIDEDGDVVWDCPDDCDFCDYPDDVDAPCITGDIYTGGPCTKVE
jgi:hypothetical protein